MKLFLAAPEVIDAGFLTTDLVDETGTKTLIVDYRGEYDGRPAEAVRFMLNPPEWQSARLSSVTFNIGTPEVPEPSTVTFTVQGFVRLKAYGSAFGDDIGGGALDDTLYGGDGDDHLFADEGDDHIFGGNGNDFISLLRLKDADLAKGGAGDDEFESVSANDTIYGGAGHDKAWLDLSDRETAVTIDMRDLSVYGQLRGIEELICTLTGQDDTLIMTAQSVLDVPQYSEDLEGYDGGAGTDRLTFDFRGEETNALTFSCSGVGETGSLYIGVNMWTPGSGGNDNLEKPIYYAFNFESVTMFGTEFGDVFRCYDSTEANTVRVFAAGGNDTITSGDVRTVIHAGSGDDLISLENREVAGRAGGVAYGDSGNDTLQATELHDDQLFGGAGNDSVTAGDGTDTVSGGRGADVLWGEGQDDLIHGGSGADILYGGTSRDTLYGGFGDDWLAGESSDDQLYGGGGNDTLTGGYNADTLTGGAGNDTFYFEGSSGSGTNLIIDFEAGDGLRFGGGLTAADVTVADAGDDLLVIWATGTALLQGMAGESVAMTFW